MKTKRSKKTGLQKTFENAEDVARVISYCANYKGNDEKVKQFCKDFEIELLQSMANKLASGPSFIGNHKPPAAANTGKQFKAIKRWTWK